MLYNKTLPDGRVRQLNRPLLTSIEQGYVPPQMDFSTSMTIWHVDEAIKRRVRDWRRLTGEDGHTGERAEKMRADHDSVYTGTYSVFPIPLAEYILMRYAGKRAKILDAFCGGPPRAIAASLMDHTYHGVDIRQEQLDENEAVIDELRLKRVHYHLGDARFLEIDEDDFDFAYTCPPYYDLEVYSERRDDVSNALNYAEFNAGMMLSAYAHYPLLRPGAFLCIVVGNFRDKEGELIDFRGHTVENFREAGFLFWQDVILSKNFASAAKRAGNAWKGMKLVPRHEHMLVFRKPETGWKRRVTL